jgi:hypothetical protein
MNPYLNKEIGVYVFLHGPQTPKGGLNSRICILNLPIEEI